MIFLGSTMMQWLVFTSYSSKVSNSILSSSYCPCGASHVKLALGVNVCVCVCCVLQFSASDSTSHLFQWNRDSLWTHNKPDQDKSETEDEYLNKCVGQSDVTSEPSTSLLVSIQLWLPGEYIKPIHIQWVHLVFPLHKTTQHEMHQSIHFCYAINWWWKVTVHFITNNYLL